MWLYGLESSIISHRLAKFGAHRHFGSEDVFLVIEEQDSSCSFKSAITIHL